jgi:hypothetical protein
MGMNSSTYLTLRLYVSLLIEIKSFQMLSIKIGVFTVD